MSKASSCCRLLTAVVVVANFAIGCAAEVGGEAEGETTTAALTTGRSFLVSFSGGSIPATADALVHGAGGTIAARYNNVGVVLARSSKAGFALRCGRPPGIDAVAAANAVFSAIDPVTATAARRTRHPRPAAGDDPLSFRQWDMNQIRAPQARAISGGKPSVLVGVIDSGIDITHPDMAGQVDTSASVSCSAAFRTPIPRSGRTTPSVTAHTSRVSSPPRKTASAWSVSRRACAWPRSRSRPTTTIRARVRVRGRVRLRRRLGDRPQASI